MTIGEIVEWHLIRYPLLGATDIYKLLHQGAFGPGHAVTNRQSAAEKLLDELAGLEPDDSEGFVEQIDPTGGLVRVNLRPLVGIPKAAESLAEALFESAAAVRPEPHVLKTRLDAAVDWLRGVHPVLAEELELAAGKAQTQGFPAGHHSLVYRLNYRPAYRVVLSRFLPEIRG